MEITILNIENMFVAFQKQSMMGVIPVIWNSLIIINIVIQGLNLLT